MATNQTPILEPQTQAFLDAAAAQGGKPIYQLSYSEARQALESAQNTDIEKSPADLEDRTLPVGPGGEVSIRIYRPQGTSKSLPAVIYFHGGGWILGSKNTHDRLLRDLVRESGLAFVFVNYTPSPEAQIPMPFEQGYAVAKYVAEHGAELSLDASRIAVAGDSAGGEIAAVVALLAKQRKGPALLGQMFFYPVTDASLSQVSYRDFADGLWLSTKAMEWFWNAFAPNVEERQKAPVSPLASQVEELRGLPPTLLITDENDVLRDEGEAYARKLIQAGVEVTAVRFLATIHDFVMLNALAKTPATKMAIKMAADWLVAALK